MGRVNVVWIYVAAHPVVSLPVDGNGPVEGKEMDGGRLRVSKVRCG